MTAADLLIRRLRDYGVRHVFGYPGGQLTPLYDALAREPAIRHVLARDEQAAGFMADAVCGPGVLNAATPLLTAFSDSTPLLLLSGQVPSQDPRSGYYHENNQLFACASFTKDLFRVEDSQQLIPALDRAWQATREGRPGPILFEAPGPLLRTLVSASPLPSLPSEPARSEPWTQEIGWIADLLADCKKPLLLAGGGILSAGAEAPLIQLAERLGAPVLHTLMGKGAIPADHPLSAGFTWHRGTSDASDMGQFMSPLFAEADGLVALGCRFTQVATGTWSLQPPPIQPCY